MKKILVFAALASGFVSCNSNGSSAEIKTDSVKRELDTLGDKIGDKAQKVWDSTQSKAKALREEIEARFDSVKKDARN